MEKIVKAINAINWDRLLSRKAITAVFGIAGLAYFIATGQESQQLNELEDRVQETAQEVRDAIGETTDTVAGEETLDAGEEGP